MLTPQSLNLTKPVYSAAEAQTLLCVGRTKFYELVGSRKLKATKCGRRTLFLASDIATFLSHLQQESQ